MNKTEQFNFKYILSISVTSALGGLLFGYDWVVIGGAKPFYERFFEITEIPSLQGWVKLQSVSAAKYLWASQLSFLFYPQPEQGGSITSIYLFFLGSWVVSV